MRRADVERSEITFVSVEQVYWHLCFTEPGSVKIILSSLLCWALIPHVSKRREKGAEDNCDLSVASSKRIIYFGPGLKDEVVGGNFPSGKVSDSWCVYQEKIGEQERNTSRKKVTKRFVCRYSPFLSHTLIHSVNPTFSRTSEDTEGRHRVILISILNRRTTVISTEDLAEWLSRRRIVVWRMWRIWVCFPSSSIQVNCCSSGLDIHAKKGTRNMQTQGIKMLMLCFLSFACMCTRL